MKYGSSERSPAGSLFNAEQKAAFSMSATLESSTEHPELSSKDKIHCSGLSVFQNHFWSVCSIAKNVLAIDGNSK